MLWAGRALGGLHNLEGDVDREPKEGRFSVGDTEQDISRIWIKVAVSDRTPGRES